MRAPWRIVVGIAAALAVLPLVARAQSADLNTSAPTKNDFRLRVVEPADGATVAGPSVRVTVGNALPADRGETGTEISKTSPVPHPDVQVMLDGRARGVLRDPQNVLTLESVTAGPHKLVVLAKNKSGEVIDRKELSFNVSGGASGSSPSSASGASASSDVAHPPATSEPTTGSAETTDRGTAPAPSSNDSAATYGSTSSGSTGSAATVPSDDRAGQTSANGTTSSRRTDSSRRTRRGTNDTADLPKTGTPYPAIALAGAALLAAGYWLRRGA